MTEFLENLQYDFTELLGLVKDFFINLRENVFNNQLSGLIMYFYHCIPVEIRTFIIVVIVLTIVLGIAELLRKD